MAVRTDTATDRTPMVEEMKALQEQLTRESAETQALLKSIVEEIQGVREDLKRVKVLLGDIV